MIDFGNLIPVKRWLRLSDLEQFFHAVKEAEALDCYQIGESEEGRALKAIRWGKGPLKILIWTQMHGNEPSATIALDHFIGTLLKEAPYKALNAKLSLLIIPMLNPDGAERFQRRNAFGIDINRDALAHSSAEMRSFQKILQDFKPDWAFNLHDQRSIFCVGHETHLATLSFLAPSADESRSINDKRQASMQLTAAIHHDICSLLPGHFGRYTDEFYPKALGDNLMKMGIANVLFEAGAYPNDPQREKAIELTQKGLESALIHIANESWQSFKIEQYDAIPENAKSKRDILFKAAQFKGCRLDIALQQVEVPIPERGDLELLYQITDIGDLSSLSGSLEWEGGILSSDKDLGINQLAHFHYRGSATYLFQNGNLQKH